MVYNYETPFPPTIYDGPPPLEMWSYPSIGDWYWRCECGAFGVSLTEQWAHSDVNRHRQNGQCAVPA